MMKGQLQTTLAVLKYLSLGACVAFSSYGYSEEVISTTASSQKKTVIVNTVQQQPMKMPNYPNVLRAVGYGAIDTEKRAGINRAQKRLFAMRASKLDAYRSMAERVYGTSISGNTSVENFIIKDEKFRTFVDATIHGAKVISVDELHDGSIKTVVELVLPPEFHDCLTQNNFYSTRYDCTHPVIHDADAHTKNELVNIQNNQRTHVQSNVYEIE